jgi:uncharacterized protein YbjT (DUF2867 family)
MNDKILVIGATGNVGSEIIRLLVEDNHKVVAAVRNPKTAEAMDWKAVQIVRFDYTKPETLQGIFEGVDKMFMISLPFDSRTAEFEIPVIDYAKKWGVNYIVKMSAMGVEYAEQSPMRIVEKHIEASGIPYTLLRPNWFMQNFSGFLASTIKSQEAFYLPADEAKTSFIDARDIAAVAVAALLKDEYRNKAYTLTGPQSLDHYEVAALISEASEKIINYVALSEEQMRQALRAQGWQESAIDYMLVIYQFVRQGFSAPISPDVKSILGRNPISFKQYTEEFAHCWK